MKKTAIRQPGPIHPSKKKRRNKKNAEILQRREETHNSLPSPSPDAVRNRRVERQAVHPASPSRRHDPATTITATRLPAYLCSHSAPSPSPPPPQASTPALFHLPSHRLHSVPLRSFLLFCFSFSLHLYFSIYVSILSLNFLSSTRPFSNIIFLSVPLLYYPFLSVPFLSSLALPTHFLRRPCFISPPIISTLPLRSFPLRSPVRFPSTHSSLFCLFFALLYSYLLLRPSLISTPPLFFIFAFFSFLSSSPLFCPLL